KGSAQVFPDWKATFVDGAGGKSVFPRMWQRMQPVVDGCIVVTLDETKRAMRLMAEKARVIAEGAGALGLAAALTGKAGPGPFVVGPIATLARLLPLAAVLVLCAALYWGQNWARWALLAPVGFRVWRLSLLTATAWGLGRPGIALFLTLIILVELAAAFILLD